MTDERAKKDDALSQEMRDIIREVIANSVPGDGAEMFDDWNKLAPHFCDYIIPDRPDDSEEEEGDAKGSRNIAKQDTRIRKRCPNGYHRWDSDGRCHPKDEVEPGKGRGPVSDTDGNRDGGSEGQGESERGGQSPSKLEVSWSKEDTEAFGRCIDEAYVGEKGDGESEEEFKARQEAGKAVRSDLVALVERNGGTPPDFKPKRFYMVYEDGRYVQSSEGGTLFDGETSTKEAYTVEVTDGNGDVTRGYTPEREELHSRIVEKLMRNFTRPPEGQRPRVIVMGGGSGAGKSSIDSVLRENGWDFQKVDPDAIMTDELPEWGMLSEQNVLQSAFFGHDEASDIAKSLYQSLVKGGYDIVYDGTFSSPSAVEKIFRPLEGTDYEVHHVGIDIDPDEGVETCHNRFIAVGRYVPDDVARKTNGGYFDMIHDEDVMDRFDSVSVYHRHGNEVTQVASKRKGETMQVQDQEVWGGKGRSRKSRKSSDRMADFMVAYVEGDDDMTKAKKTRKADDTRYRIDVYADGILLVTPDGDRVRMPYPCEDCSIWDVIEDYDDRHGTILWDTIDQDDFVFGGEDHENDYLFKSRKSRVRKGWQTEVDEELENVYSALNDFAFHFREYIDHEGMPEGLFSKLDAFADRCEKMADETNDLIRENIDASYVTTEKSRKSGRSKVRKYGMEEYGMEIPSVDEVLDRWRASNVGEVEYDSAGHALYRDWFDYGDGEWLVEFAFDRDVFDSAENLNDLDWDVPARIVGYHGPDAAWDDTLKSSKNKKSERARKSPIIRKACGSKTEREDEEPAEAPQKPSESDNGTDDEEDTAEVPKVPQKPKEKPKEGYAEKSNDPYVLFDRCLKTQGTRNGLTYLEVSRICGDTDPDRLLSYFARNGSVQKMRASDGWIYRFENRMRRI